MWIGLCCFRGVYHYENTCFHCAMMNREEGGLPKFLMIWLRSLTVYWAVFLVVLTPDHERDRNREKALSSLSALKGPVRPMFWGTLVYDCRVAWEQIQQCGKKAVYPRHVLQTLMKSPLKMLSSCLKASKIFPILKLTFLEEEWPFFFRSSENVKFWCPETEKSTFVQMWHQGGLL